MGDIRCGPIHNSGAMLVLKKSRTALKPGDTFVYRIAENQPYGWGRVIRTDAWAYQVGGLILCYFYNAFSAEPSRRPPLTPGTLLLPPVLTNRLGWSRGYFMTVSNDPIGPGDVLMRHIFRDPFRRRHFDDDGQEVARPFGPIGICGVHSYASIQYELCKVLGIPEPT